MSAIYTESVELPLPVTWGLLLAVETAILNAIPLEHTSFWTAEMYTPGARYSEQSLYSIKAKHTPTMIGDPAAAGVPMNDFYVHAGLGLSGGDVTTPAIGFYSMQNEVSVMGTNKLKVTTLIDVVKQEIRQPGHYGNPFPNPEPMSDIAGNPYPWPSDDPVAPAPPPAAPAAPPRRRRPAWLGNVATGVIVEVIGGIILLLIALWWFGVRGS